MERGLGQRSGWNFGRFPGHVDDDFILTPEDIRRWKERQPAEPTQQEEEGTGETTVVDFNPAEFGAPQTFPGLDAEPQTVADMMKPGVGAGTKEVFEERQ